MVEWNCFEGTFMNSKLSDNEDTFDIECDDE